MRIRQMLFYIRIFRLFFRNFKKGGIRQAVVFAKKRAQYEIDIVSKGIIQYFETTVLEEDTTTHKPNPEPLYYALRKMHLSQEEVLYIGDSIVDSIAAELAHVDFGLALWGNLSREDMKEPTLVLERP